jgi:hypothetical protein
MEQRCGPLSVEIVSGNTAISALILQRERKVSLAHAQRYIFLFMKQCCGPLAVDKVPGYTVILAPILPRKREISLAHAPNAIS